MIKYHCLNITGVMPMFIRALFLSVFLPCCATAQISVGESILHFKAGQRTVQNVTVRNGSEDVMYVTVSSDLIMNPQITEPQSQPAKELYVSPKKFSVPPNGERTVRVVLAQVPKENEQVYRITFAPEDRGFGDEVEHTSEGRKAVLRVLTGMGILVFADPLNPKPDLVWERLPGKLIFENKGNVHVKLALGKACKVLDSACRDLPAKRIYGGSRYEYDVDDSERIVFEKKEGATGNPSELVIPAKIEAKNQIKE